MLYRGFISGSYVSQSPSADQERTVNWYVEEIESRGGTTRHALYPTPGVSAITLTYPTISTPGTPIIANAGTPGATTYGYKVVALLADQSTHTAASAEGSTTTGNATLSTVNYNTVSWSAVTGATHYDVYRTTGGATPPKLLVHATTSTSYDDIGTSVSDTTPPVSATTGTTVSLSGPGRAHLADNGVEYVVSGTIFGDVSVSNIFTPRGLVAQDANPATISSNGDGGGQLFVVSGTNAYCYDVTAHSFTQVTTLDGIATMGDFLDGYFLCLDSNTGTMRISDLLDGQTWDPTQFIQRSSAGDSWISMKVANRYIYLLGSVTSEVWYDAGTFPIPFVQHSSGVMQYGCVAPFSPEVVGTSLVWLGATVNGPGSILATSGFQPEDVSTYALHVAFDSYSTLADAVGDTYEWQGHTFYLLTFPTANASWAYDSNLTPSMAWHEPLTWITEHSAYDGLHWLYHAFIYGQHRVLDRTTGTFYFLSDSVGTDVDGRVIRRLRRAPAIVSENRLLYYGTFELDLEVGLGLTTGQGSNPTVMMRMSNDGGKTWSNEITASAGARGTYSTRVRFTPCGAARRRVFEISVTDGIPWRILNAFLDGPGMNGVAA